MATLLARYLFTDATSGQTQNTIGDSGPNGLDVPITSWATSGGWGTDTNGTYLEYARDGNRTKTQLTGTALETAFNGLTDLTMVCVTDGQTSIGSRPPMCGSDTIGSSSTLRFSMGYAADTMARIQATMDTANKTYMFTGGISLPLGFTVHVGEIECGAAAQNRCCLLYTSPSPRDS